MRLVANRVASYLMFCLSLVSMSAQAQHTRIKDLTSVKGVRSNQLVGIGLVIGLASTGDTTKSLATNKAYTSMMQNLGIALPNDSSSSQNVAAVVLTAELPPFSRIGDRINLRVSAVGDAKSLAGGTLVMSALRATDNQVYAMAQGSIVSGQANGAGPQVQTVAVIPDGAVVEREFIPTLAKNSELQLNLKSADFTTNSRISDKINGHFRGFYARSVDPNTIHIDVPVHYQDKVVEFMGELELLRVDVDRKAKVVINERTGTIVLGSDVLVSPVAVSHGQLSIRVGKSKEEDKKESQPQGVVSLDGQATVGSLLETLNNLGVKPPDLIGIVQAIHAAGALQAEIELM